MAHFIWPVLIVKHFSLPLTKVDIHFGHVRMYAMPYPISWIIFILDLEPLNRQIVGIPMGSNCAPLVADLFLYCFERDFFLFYVLVFKIFCAVGALCMFSYF